MKKIMLLLLLSGSISLVSAQCSHGKKSCCSKKTATSTTTTGSAELQGAKEIKVSGNCGMCKTRIETAVNKVDGVTASSWNSETKILSVSFDEKETDIKRIAKAIAMAGHDNEYYKADEKTYSKLPGCCQYDRTN